MRGMSVDTVCDVHQLVSLKQLAHRNVYTDSVSMNELKITPGKHASQSTPPTVNSYRGVTRGKGGTIPRAPNHYRGAKSLRGRRKVQKMSQVYLDISNTVNLLPKELRVEHGGTKLASCPGRHLPSSRP